MLSAGRQICETLSSKLMSWQVMNIFSLSFRYNMLGTIMIRKHKMEIFSSHKCFTINVDIFTDRCTYERLLHVIWNLGICIGGNYWRPLRDPCRTISLATRVKLINSEVTRACREQGKCTCARHDGSTEVGYWLSVAVLVAITKRICHETD